MCQTGSQQCNYQPALNCNGLYCWLSLASEKCSGRGTVCTRMPLSCSRNGDKRGKEQLLCCVGTSLDNHFQQLCMTRSSPKQFRFTPLCIHLETLLLVHFALITVINPLKTSALQHVAVAKSMESHPNTTITTGKTESPKKLRLNKNSELHKVWQSNHEAKNLESAALFIIGLSRKEKGSFKRLNVHQPRLLIPLCFSLCSKQELNY